jgi:hypothetical protein
MATYLKINLNDRARVKMTPLGLKIFDEYWNHPGAKGNAREIFGVTVDGWYETEMWSIANIFGPHMQNGFDAPLETMILVRDEGRGTEEIS